MAAHTAAMLSLPNHFSVLTVLRTQIVLWREHVDTYVSRIGAWQAELVRRTTADAATFRVDVPVWDGATLELLFFTERVSFFQKVAGGFFTSAKLHSDCSLCIIPIPGKKESRCG